MSAGLATARGEVAEQVADRGRDLLAARVLVESAAVGGDPFVDVALGEPE